MARLFRKGAGLAGIMACLAICAQTQQPASNSTIAIRAGRLIDVRTGNVATNQYIVVTKDRITAISDSAPAGVVIVDLSKYTVVPGLIDCHAHVLGDMKDQSSTSGLRMSSAQKAIWGGA
jgi:imidazolonepropionase-like amidohydrolase